MSTAQKTDFVSMPLNPYSLGMIIEFLTRYHPFDGFEAGALVNALSFQLGTGSNLIASCDDQIVAYVGWVPTTISVAEAWMRTGDLLTPAENADTAAITILATVNPDVLQALIRAAKQKHPFRHVVWRRYFQDQRGQRVRRLNLRTPAPSAEPDTDIPGAST